MKIILTGSTGAVGGEVLQQCLQHPSISTVIALSRRPLPALMTDNPKLDVIIMDDFLAYNDSVLRQLDGAQACIWALGGPAFRYADAETARKVNLEYTIVAAKAFFKLGNGKRFKFVFCSGNAVERDQSKNLWFMKDSRQIKGETENQLIQLARENQDTFAAFLARAGSVVPKNNKALLVVAILTTPLNPFLAVDELAAAMIDTAVNGGSMQTLTNADMVSRGRLCLNRQA